VSEPTRIQLESVDPRQRKVRRSWRLLVASLALLGLAVVVDVLSGPQPLGAAVVGLVLVVAAAAAVHRRDVETLESDRRAEAESFARILQGLSRSVSADAIVEAIVSDLAVATGADHVVLARRRPGARALEATLVSSRPGIRSSTTLFPMTDLHVPVGGPGSLDGRSVPPLAVSVGAPQGDLVTATVASPVRQRTATATATATASGAVRGISGYARRAGAVAALGLASSPIPVRPSVDRDGPGRGSPGRAAAERIATRARDVYGLRHTLAVPLMGDDGVVGAIVVSRRTAEPWPAAARRILAGAAVEASAALSRAHSHRDAEARAATDALTGLPNRRYFDEFCGLLARRRRAEDAVGVLMIDIDRFKVLNDEHGHEVGDQVLRAVGTAIAAAVRDADVPARYGGEEFAVVLRNPGQSVAADVGERVRASVSSLDLRALGVPRVTVSVGAAVAAVPDEPIAHLIGRADAALYQAKRRGRNRVVVA
jgi:diguanylate cyclase (GGDEF)-like protein